MNNEFNRLQKQIFSIDSQSLHICIILLIMHYYTRKFSATKYRLEDLCDVETQQKTDWNNLQRVALQDYSNTVKYEDSKCPDMFINVTFDISLSLPC